MSARPKTPAAPVPRTLEGDKAELRQLHETWSEKPGLKGILLSNNHETLGKRYVLTALAFFAVAGVEALLMRIQLARPENTFLGPDLYNQLFTMHGTTMMFLFAVPIMLGMGVYLVPLMIGTREFPFPKLNAYGYWLYLFGGIFLYVEFFLGAGADRGWFSYVPLAGPQFSPGKRVDSWAQMITFTEISSLVVAINIIVAVFKLRAPGMSLNRIPLFAWSELVTSFMVIFAMPAVMLSSTYLILDRLIGTHFFNASMGGDSLLWQHLFWFFGHPEVYIIFIPALGMVSTIIGTFSRRSVMGYTALLLSLVATAFLGFGLWVHHMFATGITQLGSSFFTVASMMIAIPSGAQIFCWLATLWTGRVKMSPPLAFVAGFFVVFVIGGVTGVMAASVPVDLQIHDTFFIVAHFHYVLIGGAVFPLFGGLHYWFPKLTGRMLDEKLSYGTFWLLFVGFNTTFFPMHILGLRGMTRRIYTYPAETKWGTLNALATAGAIVLGLAVLSFVVNAARSAKRGIPSGRNPWGASGLEWATSSPPPPYGFARLPIVKGREPLWEEKEDEMPVVTGLRTDRREVLVTRPLDAEPDHRAKIPNQDGWPFATAVVTTIGLVGSVYSPVWIPAAAIPLAICLVGWYWPKEPITSLPPEERA